MKLYYFTLSGDYGLEYYVMAKSKLIAINNLLTFLYDNVKTSTPGIRTDGSTFENFDEREYRIWSDAIKNNTLPRGYSIKELGANEVLVSEIS